MKPNSTLSRIVVVLLALFTLGNLMTAQTVKNKNTFTNNNVLNVGTFQNHNGGTGGTLNNNAAGVLTASTSVNNADNTSNINNLGQITVSTGGSFNNSVAGGVVDNTSNGRITLAGTASYDNTAGTTNNSAASATNGFIVNGALTVGTLFDTQTGRVEYGGSASQTLYSGVVNATYGLLELSTTGTRQMDGDVTSGNITIGAPSTLEVNENTLTATGTGGIGGAGALDADGAGASEVAYTGDSNQPVKSATYDRLILSGSTAARSKAASGNVTIQNAFQINDNFTTFDVNANLTYTGTAANFTNTNAGSKIALDGDASVTDTATAVGNFDYDGAVGDQTIASAQYTNLALSGAATKTMPVWNGTSIGGVYVSGNYTDGGGTTYTGSIFGYNGAGAQTVAGAGYASLYFFNVGVKTLSGTATTSSGLFVHSSVNTGNGFYVAATGDLTVTGEFINDGTVVNDGSVTVQ